ncbi:MAG: hypothetical protein FJ095_20525 [Deltaproteobacteria bacterium]|nr:hypothetical protein [Deltaproteobacteria bacterium]
MRNLVSFTLTLALLAGCEGAGSHPAPSPSAVTETAGASASASQPPPPPKVPTYPERKLEAGSRPKEPWTRGFAISRIEGGTGLEFLDAQGHCRERGLSLCTETQWTRACDADASLGAIETWTASTVSGDRPFVVRGGKDGCTARETTLPFDRKVERAAVCCERAVGIRTTNTNAAFLGASSKFLLDLERAVNDGNRAAFEALYAQQTRFLGKPFTRAGIGKELTIDLGKFPKQWVVRDVCDVSLGKDEAGDATLVASCQETYFRGKPYGARVTYVRGGPDNAILEVK